jgi:NAD(P)H-flavin reductase
MVGVRGPFGTSWPVEAAEGKDVVIVAGGIGLAPLRPVIYQLQARRERYGRIALLYGARTPRDLLYGTDLLHWRSRFDLQVEVTVDSPVREWKGNVGVVTTLIPHAVFGPSETMAMVCGPEVMMRFTVAELQRHGVPAEAIYLSLERNMKCAVGVCGHCQFGPYFVCRQGPVFRLPQVAPLLGTREM